VEYLEIILVHAFLQKFGTVDNIRFVKDRKTGCAKTLAYVRFTSAYHAALALEGVDPSKYIYMHLIFGILIFMQLIIVVMSSKYTYVYVYKSDMSQNRPDVLRPSSMA